MNRKKIFFTSDWHLYHENILKFSNRPFKDVDHMHRVLINNYNAVVPENGICYFLGDMGKMKQPGFDKIINQLNGIKVLILGNHDNGVNVMYRAGFDVVLNSCSMIVSNELVTLSHYPLLGVFREDVRGMRNAVLTDNWHNEHKHLIDGIKNNGQFHLAGHLHLRKDHGKIKEGRQWDVGVDGNYYRPVSISQIESWIVKTKELENEKK